MVRAQRGLGVRGRGVVADGRDPKPSPPTPAPQPTNPSSPETEKKGDG